MADARVKKAKPCQHRRWTRVKLVASSDHYGNGEPHPDSRKHYRVLEVMRCVKCDAAGTRWTRFYAATERSALKRAGMPEDQLPLPPNHKVKPKVEVPLTSWPFPDSTYFHTYPRQEAKHEQA